MRLNELLDTPPLEYENEYDDNVYFADFTTANGQDVSLTIESDGHGYHELAFNVDGAYGITGKGEAIEIFSTVIDILQKFLDKNPKGEIHFNSAQPNRTALYHRLLRTRLKPPYKYNHQKNFNNNTMFMISRDE